MKSICLIDDIKRTDCVLPVKREDGLKTTIDYEFVRKTEGHVFHCETESEAPANFREAAELFFEPQK